MCEDYRCKNSEALLVVVVEKNLCELAVVNLQSGMAEIRAVQEEPFDYIVQKPWN